MSINRIASVGLVALALAGCAQSMEERARIDAVRMVRDAEAAKGCDLLSVEHDGDIRKFREKAADKGGNLVLLTERQQYVFPWSMEPIAEVYRCP